MQDLHPNRVDDLLNTITEARRSLSTWQDKQTEALIRLDSFTYDIQQLEEEKRKINAQNLELKREIENNQKIHESQVGEITDQMQVLKLENETLQNEVIKKEQAFELAQNEIESLKKNRAQLIEQHLEREKQASLDLEVKFSNQILEQRAQIETMNIQNRELASQKEALEIRTDRLEYELSQLRSRLMTVLNVDEPSSAFEAAKAQHSATASKREKQPELSMQDVIKIRSPDAEPTTVEDYLKRFGY